MLRVQEGADGVVARLVGSNDAQFLHRALAHLEGQRLVIRQDMQVIAAVAEAEQTAAAGEGALDVAGRDQAEDRIRRGLESGHALHRQGAGQMQRARDDEAVV